MLGRPWLGRHGRRRGARSRRLGGPGPPASSRRLRLLERVETRLERRNTAVERIDRPQPQGDITEALPDPVHHPTRPVDNLSERVLADVGKLRDHVPVVLALLLGHDLTIAPPATPLQAPLSCRERQPAAGVFQGGPTVRRYFPTMVTIR